MIRANKGEWSELYVLFKLLGEKRVYAGDGDLNRLEAYYPILRILRNELERSLEYAEGDKDIVVVTEDGVEVARLSAKEFLDNSKILFDRIRKGSGGNGTFEIPSLDNFLRKIHCEKIKAKSSDKADIHIVIHDYHTGLNANLGFSIKSEIGCAPTLLNASNATLFTYEVAGNRMSDKTIDMVNNISEGRKIQDRVRAIYKNGSSLLFKGTRDIFYNNLFMIDSTLPEIVAWMMADSYLQRDMDIQKATERITNANPLDFDLSLGHDHYEYKLKSLLVAIALGMLPGKTWSGKYEATGGYLVVKDDGDIVCFHIFDRNMLEDYLFKNTKFDSPKSDRYDHMAQIYKGADGKTYFNLVLQIRFKGHRKP